MMLGPTGLRNDRFRYLSGYGDFSAEYVAVTAARPSDFAANLCDRPISYRADTGFLCPNERDTMLIERLNFIRHGFCEPEIQRWLLAEGSREEIIEWLSIAAWARTTFAVWLDDGLRDEWQVRRGFAVAG